MPQQPELIGPQPLTLTPASGLAGPRLWVRRLVLWKEPGGEKVRDITLRPGLNIIWSPDGADDATSVGQENAIGHGSGKTLFCRLIRYCLGEDRFATEAQRERIGTAFVNGIVGADVMLDGTCWAIIRPLGARRRHMAGTGTWTKSLPAKGLRPGSNRSSRLSTRASSHQRSPNWSGHGRMDRLGRSPWRASPEIRNAASTMFWIGARQLQTQVPLCPPAAERRDQGLRRSAPS
jgi:hypothetical protein